LATLRIEELPAGIADKVLVAAGVAPRTIPTTLAGVAPPRTIDTRGAAAWEPGPAHSAAMTLETGSITPEPGPAPPAAVIPFQRRSRVPMIAAWVAAAACFVLAVGAVIWAIRKPP